MGSMRFRFDGQPINETDTPIQVQLPYRITSSNYICSIVTHLYIHYLITKYKYF